MRLSSVRRTLLVAWLLLSLSLSALPAAQADSSLYTLRQRFGVNVATSFWGTPSFPGSLTSFAGVEQMGFGWYSDWTVQVNPPRPGGIEFAQLLPINKWPPDWNNLRTAIQANPGALWIIGNEPETRGQGEKTPAQYAAIYHDAYQFIKGVDPSAQIAIGGVVMPSPLRLKWLDLCLAHYQQTYGTRMPVDVWNIHMQILNEKRCESADDLDCWGCGIPFGLSEAEGRRYTIDDNCSVSIFKQLIVEFCQWLVRHGERNKPLIISEYGTLMPSTYLGYGDRAFGDQRVMAFMQGTFDYMLGVRDPVLGYAADGGRLVQRWMWFSLNFPFYDDTPGGFNGALYNWQRPSQLTVFGEYFKRYIELQTLDRPYQALLPYVVKNHR